MSPAQRKTCYSTSKLPPFSSSFMESPSLSLSLPPNKGCCSIPLPRQVLRGQSKAGAPVDSRCSPSLHPQSLLPWVPWVPKCSPQGAVLTSPKGTPSVPGGETKCRFSCQGNQDRKKDGPLSSDKLKDPPQSPLAKLKGSDMRQTPKQPPVLTNPRMLTRHSSQRDRQPYQTLTQPQTLHQLSEDLIRVSATGRVQITCLLPSAARRGTGEL